jgi:hypothetical protein
VLCAGCVYNYTSSLWQVPASTCISEDTGADVRCLDGFSAACWFTAQELTDIAAVANEPIPIFGMVQTAWGGSEIDDWIKNSSIAECKNAEGLPEPNRQGPGRGGDGEVYPNNGALWNGTCIRKSNSSQC